MVRISSIAGVLLIAALAIGQVVKDRGIVQTVRFGSLEWWVKDTDDRKADPGRNWFSARNIEVDAGGRLHLKIGSRDGSCVSAEIVTWKSLGYGTYRFTVDSNLDDLAKNLVLGLFTWDDSSSADAFHREMDVEIGRWNEESNADAQFVIQPHSIQRNIERFRLPRGLQRSVHTFTWTAGRAAFRSEGVDSAGVRILIREHVFDRMIPEPGTEKARINLWCVDSKVPDAGRHEVVLSNFEFEALH